MLFGSSGPSAMGELSGKVAGKWRGLLRSTETGKRGLRHHMNNLTLDVRSKKYNIYVCEACVESARAFLHPDTSIP